MKIWLLSLKLGFCRIAWRVSGEGRVSVQKSIRRARYADRMFWPPLRVVVKFNGVGTLEIHKIPTNESTTVEATLELVVCLRPVFGHVLSTNPVTPMSQWA